MHCVTPLSHHRELLGSLTSEQVSLLIARNIEKSLKMFAMKCEQMVSSAGVCVTCLFTQMYVCIISVSVYLVNYPS